MKKIFICLSSVCILFFALSSCKKIIDKLFSPIDINLPAFQVQVPAIPVATSSEISLGSITAHFNVDSTIKANTGGLFGLSAVSTIKVKQMTFDVSNADQNDNLANFESARFSLSSNANTVPSEIASLSFPDTYSATSSVTPANSPELKGYFNGTELTYTLSGKVRRPTTKPLTISVLLTLSVK